MKRRFVSLICGYYGMGNLGDELLLAAVLKELESVGVDRDRVAVLSGDTKGTSSFHGVTAFDRWSFSEVWRACRSSSNCLFGGGGLFQDVTSVRSVLYYGGVVAISRAAGCVPWLFGNSLGPFRSCFGRRISSLALRACSVVALRDDHSMAEAGRMGISARRCPDPVMSLNVPRGRGDSLLVNLRPWNGDLEFRAAGAIADYAERKGFSVVGVAMCGQDRDLLDRLDKDGLLPVSDVVEPKGADDPVWGAGFASIGMRLHFCLLSSLAGLPGTAVPYDPKVVDFGRSVGYSLWDGIGPFPDPKAPNRAWIDRCRKGVSETFRDFWREVCRG